MRLMKNVTSKLAVVGAGVAIVVAAGGTPAQAAPTACPVGAACLYTTAGNPADGNVGLRTHVWWQGVYNLSDVYGARHLHNNQTDGWVVDLCYGYNGTNCGPAINPGWIQNDFTPINSVRLRPA
ncbi:hypothetical protein AB0M36_35050 [Actinoplanes sp. NPDC051346]|uniref:hypothetical protein n=1 Tax=Actinoplanes sp. NPDC051346 TaxID=3155048 RepID=UPI00341547BA